MRIPEGIWFRNIAKGDLVLKTLNNSYRIFPNQTNLNRGFLCIKKKSTQC